MTAALCVSGGCRSVGYVAHVGAGQMRLLWQRELLSPELVAKLSPEEQRGLRAIERAKLRAVEIGLEPSGSYRHMIERADVSTVHVVVASPPDRLEPVTWWFPIVGRVGYQGYFDEARAKALAAELRSGGYDAYVRPALLYSTLGYFDDPIPRAALRWSEFDLYDVVIHELVHGTIFVRDDIAYNEALASFIAEEATLAMLSDQPELRAEAERNYSDEHRYADLIERLALELEDLYRVTHSREEALEQRARLFRRYQTEIYPTFGWRTSRFDGFAKLELTNAFVVAQRTYSGDLPCFRDELASLGGDLIELIRVHRERPGRHEEVPSCAARMASESRAE